MSSKLFPQTPILSVQDSSYDELSDNINLLTDLLGNSVFTYEGLNIYKVIEKLKETSDLEIGSEIVQGTFERIVELKVGDELPQIMNSEVLLEDGKILAFRN